jgi:anti-sigma factor RsiW
MSCERYEPLLSAWIDGELVGEDRAALMAHLESCDACRRAGESLAAVARSTREGLTPPAPPAGVWDSLGARVVTRLSRTGGWWLIVPALFVLAAYGGYEFATDDALDALVKVSVAAGILGLGLLFVSVLFERLRDRRTERYGEVKR